MNEIAKRNVNLTQDTRISESQDFKNTISHTMPKDSILFLDALTITGETLGERIKTQKSQILISFAIIKTRIHQLGG